MRAWMPFLLLFALTANAGTISRLYDFQPGTKAEADKVDAEFDNIIGTVNGNIDSTNILDGSIATADLGSSVVTTVKINNNAVTLVKLASGNANTTWLHDYRKGCGLNYASSGEVFIGTPCELVVDGLKGRLTATQSVFTLLSMDAGSIAANKVYYIYGAPTALTAIDFRISLATPNTVTARKPTDSTYRYIGSFRTKFLTSNVADFIQLKNRYDVFDTASGNGMHIASGPVSSTVLPVWFNVPSFAKFIFGAWKADDITGAVAGDSCLFNNFSTSPGLVFSSNVTKTYADIAGLDAVGRQPYTYISIANGSAAMSFTASKCLSNSFRAYGWIEPEELY